MFLNSTTDSGVSFCADALLLTSLTALLLVIIIIIIINVKINVALSENASRTRYTIKIKLKLRKWVLEKISFQPSFLPSGPDSRRQSSFASARELMPESDRWIYGAIFRSRFEFLEPVSGGGREGASLSVKGLDLCGQWSVWCSQERQAVGSGVTRNSEAPRQIFKSSPSSPFPTLSPPPLPSFPLPPLWQLGSLGSAIASSVRPGGVSRQTHYCAIHSPKSAHLIFSERELMFMFAICRRPSVCRLSVVCL